MKTLSTKRCHEKGCPEVCIRFDEETVLLDDAESFIRGLEETVLSGARFRDEQSLQVGWTMARFRMKSQTLLALLAPDMISFPIRYEESVSEMLAQLRLQRDVAVSLGLEPEFPSMFHAGVTCSWLASAESLSLERWEPEGMASGWAALCESRGHDHENVANLVRESLYAMVLKKREIMEYLALPPGSRVLVSGQQPQTIYFEEAEIRPAPGSYLAARSQ